MIRITTERKCTMLWVMNIILVIMLVILCLHYGTFSRALDILTEKNTEERSYSYCKSEIYKFCPRTEDDIIFIGDSITDRGEFHEYFPGFSVKNRGIEADTTEKIVNRLDTILTVPPQKVFIMVGINDIGNGVDKKAFQENYCSIIEMIQESDLETEIYIQSILPVNHGIMVENKRNSRRSAETINEYNEALKEIAEFYAGQTVRKHEII